MLNMKARLILALALVHLPAIATDMTGNWKAQFDSQIGLQKYTYTLKQEGNTLTGTAKCEIGGEKHESKLQQGKVEGDAVSFVELLNFRGNDLEIRYNGAVS